MEQFDSNPVPSPEQSAEDFLQGVIERNRHEQRPWQLVESDCASLNEKYQDKIDQQIQFATARVILLDQQGGIERYAFPPPDSNGIIVQEIFKGFQVQIAVEYTDYSNRKVFIWEPCIKTLSSNNLYPIRDLLAPPRFKRRGAPPARR